MIPNFFVEKSKNGKPDRKLAFTLTFTGEKSGKNKVKRGHYDKARDKMLATVI